MQTGPTKTPGKIWKDGVQKIKVVNVQPGRGEGKVEDIYDPDVHQCRYHHLMQPDRHTARLPRLAELLSRWWPSTPFRETLQILFVFAGRGGNDKTRPMTFLAASFVDTHHCRHSPQLLWRSILLFPSLMSYPRSIPSRQRIKVG